MDCQFFHKNTLDQFLYHLTITFGYFQHKIIKFTTIMMIVIFKKTVQKLFFETSNHLFRREPFVIYFKFTLLAYDC